MKIEDLKDRENKRYLNLNTARYHNVSLCVGHREISIVFVHSKVWCTQRTAPLNQFKRNAFKYDICIDIQICRKFQCDIFFWSYTGTVPVIG